MVVIKFNVVVIMSKLNYYLQSNEHIIIIDSHCDGFCTVIERTTSNATLDIVHNLSLDIVHNLSSLIVYQNTSTSTY